MEEGLWPFQEVGVIKESVCSRHQTLAYKIKGESIRTMFPFCEGGIL